MSSLFNVSNGSSKPEEFSLKNIGVLVDKKEQNWIKRAHIGQYLGMARIIMSTAKLSEEDIRSQASSKLKGGDRYYGSPLRKMLKTLIFSSRLMVPFMSL